MGDALSVLIPDGEKATAFYVAQCLVKPAKVKLFILSSQQETWARFSRYPYLYRFEPGWADQTERFKATVDIIKRFNIDVVLPISGSGIEFVLKKYKPLAEMTALSPVPDPLTFNIAQNKWLLTQFAHEQHLPVPRSFLVTLDPDFYQQLSTLEHPVLLKPVRGFGGRGIQRFDHGVHLQTFLETQNADQFKNQYLVQEYVPGIDLGLSVLCRHGEILAFTIQQGLIANKGFGGLLAMQFIQQEEVLENGRKLLSALNWNGVAHIDMRYDSRDGQVKLLEVNPRFWGSLLGSLVVGVNFPYLACLMALNIPFAMPPYRLGKYLHTGTALKEIGLRLFGKNRVDRFTLSETGLRFFVTDPMPEIINWVNRLQDSAKIKFNPLFRRSGLPRNLPSFGLRIPER